MLLVSAVHSSRDEIMRTRDTGPAVDLHENMPPLPSVSPRERRVAAGEVRDSPAIVTKALAILVRAVSPRGIVDGTEHMR